MSLIDRDALLNWIKAEEDMMRAIGDLEMAHEASYIRKYVSNLPEVSLREAVKENCKAQGGDCSGCEFLDRYGRCDFVCGDNLPEDWT